MWWRVCKECGRSFKSSDSVKEPLLCYYCFEKLDDKNGTMTDETFQAMEEVIQDSRFTEHQIVNTCKK